MNNWNLDSKNKGTEEKLNIYETTKEKKILKREKEIEKG